MCLPSPAPFVIVGIACLLRQHRPRSAGDDPDGGRDDRDASTRAAGAMIAVAYRNGHGGQPWIYEHQVKDRRSSPGHRFRDSMPLLATVPATESMQPAEITLIPADPVDRAQRQLTAVPDHEAAVVDERGAYLGMVSLGALRDVNVTKVGDAVDTSASSLPEAASLEDAVEGLAASGYKQVPILDDARRIVGIVTATQVVKAYRTALQANLRGLGTAPPGTSLVEATVGDTSSLLGRDIGDGSFPPGTVVMAVLREGSILVPGDNEVLHAGDALTLLAPGDTSAVRALIEGRLV